MDNHKKQKDALDYVMDCMCASHDVRERSVTGVFIVLFFRESMAGRLTPDSCML